MYHPCTSKYQNSPRELFERLISHFRNCENGKLVYPPPARRLPSTPTSSASVSCTSPATQFFLSDDPYENYFYSDCHMSTQVIVSSPGPSDNLTLIAPRLLVSGSIWFTRLQLTWAGRLARWQQWSRSILCSWEWHQRNLEDCTPEFYRSWSVSSLSNQ